MADSLISRLDQVINCSLCSTPFESRRKPMQLNCFHTFCSTCVNRLIRNAEMKKCDSVPCPSCGCTSSVAEAKACHVNGFIQNVVSIIGEVTEAISAQMCCGCEKRKKTLFCQDCCKGYCQECNNVVHNVIHGHERSEPISNLDKSKIVEIASLNRQHCKVNNHSGKIIDYYCLSCDELICADCAIVGHENHSKMVLKDAAEKRGVGLEDKINHLIEICDDRRKLIEQLTNKREQIEEDSKNTLAQVTKQADSIIFLVNLERDKVIAAVKSEISNINHTIASLSVQLQQNIYRLKNYIYELKLALDLNNPSLLLQTIQEYLQELEQYDEEDIKETLARNDQVNFQCAIDVTSISPKDLLGSCIFANEICKFNLDFNIHGMSICSDILVASRNRGSSAEIFAHNGEKQASIQLSEDFHITELIATEQHIYLSKTGKQMHVFDKLGNNVKTMNIPECVVPYCLAKFHETVFLFNMKSEHLFTLPSGQLDGKKIEYSTQFQKNGHLNVNLTGQLSLAVNDHLVVLSDNGTHQVHAFGHDGRHIFTYGTGKPGHSNGQLHHPWDVCCHRDHLIIADHFNSRLVLLSENGTLLGYIKFEGLCGPRSVKVGKDGLLRVAYGFSQGPWYVSTIRYNVL